MEKTLETGKDYGLIFGLDAKKSQKMVYNGGISWTAINGDLQITDDSQETTNDAINHLYLMPDYKSDVEIIGNVGYRRKGGR